MANIQQVRYAAQPAPGFMDYAADFLTSYMGTKEAKKEQANKELMTLLPALAAQGQIQVGGGIPYGGIPGGIGVIPKQPDQSDVYNQLRSEELGIKLGKVQPNDTYLQNTAWDEADKELNRNTMYQMMSMSPDAKRRALADETKRARATQIYERMKVGYNPNVKTSTQPTQVPVSTQELDYARKQLKKGYVLIRRDGVTGQIPAGEVLPTDERL